MAVRSRAEAVQLRCHEVSHELLPIGPTRWEAVGLVVDSKQLRASGVCFQTRAAHGARRKGSSLRRSAFGHSPCGGTSIALFRLNHAADADCPRAFTQGEER
jgi:hypothetical protein